MWEDQKNRVEYRPRLHLVTENSHDVAKLYFVCLSSSIIEFQYSEIVFGAVAIARKGDERPDSIYFW